MECYYRPDALADSTNHWKHLYFHAPNVLPRFVKKCGCQFRALSWHVVSNWECRMQFISYASINQSN